MTDAAEAHAEALKLAAQWKGRADDAGLLARAILALPEVTPADAKDAARYRWLRRPGELEGLENIWWDDYGIVTLSYDDVEHLTGEELDAAIDRGIAESSPPQKE